MSQRKKVAILGGGMGAMSALYWITNQPDWQDKYEVTVYQMGWRLGGKGASGRNPKAASRIEEHGFHILFGFYENTFHTMRQCYKQLGRTGDSPLAEFIAPTLADEEKHPNRYAMKRSDFLRFYDPRSNPDGNWKPLLGFYAPQNDRLPGDGDKPLSLWDYLRQLWAWMYELHQFIKPVDDDAEEEKPAWIVELNKLKLPDIGPIDDIWEGFKRVVDHVGTDIANIDLGNIVFDDILPVLGKLLKLLPHDYRRKPNKLEAWALGLVPRLLKMYMRRLWERLGDKIDTDWDLYSLWVRQDFVATHVIGFIEDDLLTKGFSHINNKNYYEWFLDHATVREGSLVTVESVLMRTLHDLCFGYLAGDTTSPVTPEKPMMGQPCVEAGTLMRALSRLLLDYKGAIGWWFQAGCGDILAAPIYEVARRKGVQFKFFHKVKQLHIDPSDSKRIGSIVVERQVNLHVGEYDPLVLVKGIPSWPSDPLYDQIVEGRELQDRKINLESSFSDWHGEEFTLTYGQDFDEIVLGISFGALPQICAELIEKNDKWQMMADQLKTVRTQVFQLWMNKDVKELGWDMDYDRPLPDGKVPNCYVDVGVEPINTYADFTEEVPHENWPAHLTPRNITYLGGPMPDDPNQPPFGTVDPAYPATQLEEIKARAIEFLNDSVKHIWPNSGTPTFDWSLLVDPENREGQERLAAQYFRVNIDPTERYVISAPGSSEHRLKAEESQYTNLILAGDWIKSGMDVGCMEATFMSGMQASRALTGEPKYIPGEDDFLWED